jgi:hypothetical protein
MEEDDRGLMSRASAVAPHDPEAFFDVVARQEQWAGSHDSDHPL